MIEVVPFERLGRLSAGWLDAHYHFSFADYLDPRRMGMGPLRVWNDDCIKPGGGFPPHSHRDFEIITYVRRGAVTHQDGMGNRGRTAAGDVQVMSAGTGIMHSEYNLDDEPLELFQIWVTPGRKGLEPRWETRSFAKADRAGRWALLASGRPGIKGALAIHQDVALQAAILGVGKSLHHPLAGGRGAYLVPVDGGIEVNGTVVGPRSGIAVRAENHVLIRAVEATEVVLMDLPIPA